MKDWTISGPFLYFEILDLFSNCLIALKLKTIILYEVFIYDERSRLFFGIEKLFLDDQAGV